MSVSGEHTRLMQERERLIVRKARIEAELNQADRIAFPAEVRSASRRSNTTEFMASLMAKEQSVFELRRKANETQLTALKQLQEFLEQEVESFGKRLAAHQEQVDLMKAELDGIKVLSDKGLATQPRVLGLRRNIAQLEGEKLRMESERTRAKQELSRVVLSRIEFDNKRSNDLTIELQQTEARLEQVVQEAGVNEQLLLETRSQAAASPLRLASTGSSSMPAPKLSYTIVRKVKDGVVEIEATESTPLQPGDTVKVTSTVPSSVVNDNFIGASDKRETTVPPTPASDIVVPAPVPDHASVEPVSTGTLQQ
jgi:polysaccharide export outer membrane protein/exopolysaccharide production protein ExoF